MQNRKDTYIDQIKKLIEPYLHQYVGQTPVLSYIEPENIITIDGNFFNYLPEEIKQEVDRLIKEHNE
ncbi:hypothetical protein [Ferruginibacter albus]|uniref:hypothetical protein n=1 Tax=Ferruginibacter albus TaxID=2875540 RepID=UPI001CC5C10B|nr:hypothetical protein [Ferruginibacter albus]UAY52884.1 hypothetical protein K9M53_04195 [Ferruginibacter albus]